MSISQSAWDRHWRWVMERDWYGYYRTRTEKLELATELREKGDHEGAEEVLAELRRKDRCQTAVRWI